MLELSDQRFISSLARYKRYTLFHAVSTVFKMSRDSKYDGFLNGCTRIYYSRI